MSLLKDTDPKPGDLRRPSVLVGSLGLVGFAPVARGTAGTALCLLGVLALYFWFAWFEFTWLPLAGVCCAMSWLTSHRILRQLPTLKDPDWFVMDEAAGFFLTLGLLRADSLLAIFAGFLTFRVYDIAKPWPVRSFERIPGSGSLGILADDLAAGVLAAWTWQTIVIVARAVW